MRPFSSFPAVQQVSVDLVNINVDGSMGFRTFSQGASVELAFYRNKDLLKNAQKATLRHPAWKLSQFKQIQECLHSNLTFNLISIYARILNSSLCFVFSHLFPMLPELPCL